MAALFCLASCLLLPGLASAQPRTDPDWPCVQRLVPELAPAALWQGPPLPELPADRRDAALDELATTLLAPDLPLAQASAQAEAFAAAQDPAAREQRVALLFTGIIDAANAQRGQLITGLKRFARNQRALAGQINDTTRKLRDLEAQGTPAAARELADMREAWSWDMRVYDERQRNLPLLCEQPVAVDQRVFALARTLASTLQ